LKNEKKSIESYYLTLKSSLLVRKEQVQTTTKKKEKKKNAKNTKKSFVEFLKELSGLLVNYTRF